MRTSGAPFDLALQIKLSPRLHCRRA